MNITILSVDIKTIPTAKGSYQTAEVAYKNNTFQGKVEGKKIMSFGATSASFKTLTTAQSGESYEVSIVKNDKGYNDWVSMTKAGAEAPAAASQAGLSTAKPSTPVGKSSYETTEERAQRQVFIIKQSSLSAAVSTLSVGAKAVKPDDVLTLAERYVDYVLGNKPKGASGFEDLPDFPSDDFPQVD